MQLTVLTVSFQKKYDRGCGGSGGGGRRAYVEADAFRDWYDVAKCGNIETRTK